MDDNYFKKLANSINESTTVNAILKDTSFLVVHVDIDCRLYCDGELLGNLMADKVEKIAIPVGEHTITVESEKCDELKEFVDMDILEGGKNYRLPIQYLREREQNVLIEQGRIKKKEEECELQLKQKSVEIEKANKEISRLEEEIADLEKQHNSLLADAERKIKDFVAKVKKEREVENETTKISVEKEKNDLLMKYSSEIKRLEQEISAKDNKLKEYSDSITKTKYEALKEQYEKALKEQYEKKYAELEEQANKRIELYSTKIEQSLNLQLSDIFVKIYGVQLMFYNHNNNTNTTFINIASVNKGECILNEECFVIVRDTYKDTFLQKEKKLDEEITKLNSQIKAKDKIINEMKNRGFSERFKDLFK